MGELKGNSACGEDVTGSIKVVNLFFRRNSQQRFGNALLLKILIVFVALTVIGNFLSSPTPIEAKSSSIISSNFSNNIVAIRAPNQRNAVQSAKTYLQTLAFSRKGLIEQLEYEGYSRADAIYGVDNSGANWNEQAVKSARTYLNTMSFSRSGLIDQLMYEGFTYSQAAHGVDAAGFGNGTSTKGNISEQTMSRKNAVQSAKTYLQTLAFSRKGLIEQLEYEGYSHADAIYGADNSGANWNEQAVKSARTYLNTMSFSRSGLIDQLMYEGFTYSQAAHGVDAAGK